ncbi:MAG: His/Gly/Thr/Pro-type tRNA ligase C-terminal domain-containing protein, partial [Rhodothermales bacterium]|nr:His/Gly/Thr/Pro-type tRNA ligase C-terminal domain-containing protein [Rhodothermales bacterium]
MAAAGAPLPESSAPDLFIVALGDEAYSRTFELAHALRSAGLKVVYDLLGRSMKAQMREANRSGARLAAIIGKDELERGVVSLKDLGTGEQEDVDLQSLPPHVTAKLG